MPEIVIDPRASRAYTNGLIELIDTGTVDKDQLIQDLLGWMSEDSVKGFCQQYFKDEDNECLIGPEDYDDEDDVDPDYPDGVDEADYEVTGCGDEYDIEYDR